MFWFGSKQFVSVVSLLYRTESFDVSIEPKQTEDQAKQLERESIFCYFSENFGLFRNGSVCSSSCFDIGSLHRNKLNFFFGFTKQTEIKPNQVLFRVVSVWFETVCFGCFASIPKQRVSFEPKQTEDQPKQFDREHIFVIFQKI